jgi:tRNA A37 threonylcarbamoyladenosine dehydratase
LTKLDRLNYNSLMTDIFDRTRKLIGPEALDRIKKSAVAVFGLGGVGSYAVEALARCGVGRLGIVDKDKVDPTNINRQLYALNSTIGKYKTDVAKKRILDINPNITVETYALFYNQDTMNNIDLKSYDYIVDAIDTITSKVLLIEQAYKLSVPIISCMGAGNRLNPQMLQVADIYSTSVCPLARVMRNLLKKRGVPSLKVVYSQEKPIVNERTPASISFVPSVAGLILSSEVIRDIIGEI